MNRYILMLLAVVGAISCARRPDSQSTAPERGAGLVMSLRSTDRIYTTEYVIRKVVAYDDVVRLRGHLMSRDIQITPPQGQRKLLIPMEATVKAYIDFSDFTADNVQFTPDSSRVTIILPDPQIELATTHIDRSQVLSLTTYGRRNFTQREIARYESQGREAIIASLPDLDLLSTARAQSYEALLPIVTAMGYDPDSVTIQFRQGLDLSAVKING